MNDLEQSEFISVEAALRRGHAHVVYPPMALFALTLIAVLLGVGHTPDWVWAVTCAGVFVAAWLWWSVALPRWRVWAIENVEDPGELILRAIGAQLMWPPGHFLELTEIRPRELENRLRWTLQVALTRMKTSDPTHVSMFHELVDPWLRRGQVRRGRAAHLTGAGWNVGLTLGPIFISIALAGAIEHIVVGSDMYVRRSVEVLVAGIVLTVISRRVAGATWLSVIEWCLVYVGFILTGTTLKSYPWHAPALLLLALGVVSGIGGVMGLRSTRQ